MKTIKQLSEELKISKEAVYKKIKYQLKDELDDHITKINNVTHIDEFGERLLFESLSLERQQAIHSSLEGDIESASFDILPETEPLNQPHLVEFVRLLQEQLRLKDKQIDIQNEHISQLITQTGYGQMLLKTSLYKNTLLIHESVATLKPHSKPFWMKFFRNNRC